MKKPTWQQVQAEVRAQYEAPPLRDANDFWADFRARAALVNQEQPVHGDAQPLRWYRPAWVLTVAALIAVLFVLAPALRNGRPPQPGAVLADHSEVQEIEVFVPL